MRITIRLLFAGLSLFQFTCAASANPPPVAFYQTDRQHQMPAINLFSKPPGIKLAALCRTVRCTDADDVSYDIVARLQESQSFADISIGKSDKTEYAIHTVTRAVRPQDPIAITTKKVTHQKTATKKVGTQAAAPVGDEQEYHSEFIVTWRKVPIAEYAFTTPDKTIAALSVDPQQRAVDLQHQSLFIAESISSQLIAALQGDQIFTSERIYRVLQADDYHRDLHPPLQIGDYRHTDFHLFPDPLLGVQLRYANNIVAGDIADVFIYPIRQVDWADADQTADTEIKSVLDEIEFAIKAKAYLAAQHSAPTAVVLRGDNREFSGRRTSGTIKLQSGQTLLDDIYVFTLKDKYIKFRFSQPANTVAAETSSNFAQDFLAGVTIPDESLFMASIRQQRRDSESH